ncbi:MAG: exodeoxyribonuclease VII large subunit [Coriobacteriia bacterium]|nr:exodeoxyribonuclease VII large subunit [Coriobacteriia bacterium]
MTAENRALSVSDAMRLAKGALEDIQVRVLGEVSECTVKPGYKAVYFTISDEYAVLPCLMWRDAYTASGLDLRPGMLVEVGGMFTAYAPKGRMQFQVRSMAPAGEGVLRLQVAALARRLEEAGLMSLERKRPLPEFPSRIGLVTSPRGKAVHDVIRTLRRRYPVAELVIAGVRVEGEAAVQSIAEGLRLMSATPGMDVVILCRGGGSYEDLMPFNAEEVACAIVACAVPVVTGIGHEPDTTIADMVADVRASTPTAAAEAVAPSVEELAQRLEGKARLLGRVLHHTVRSYEHRLRLLQDRPVLRDPVCTLGARMQAVDLAAGALGRALPARLSRDREAVARASKELLRVAPRLSERHADRVGHTGARLADAGSRMLERTQRDVERYAARLDDLSPLAILRRGYAVCYDESGSVVVRSVGDVSVGDRVAVRLAEGSLGCVVDSVRSEI